MSLYRLHYRSARTSNRSKVEDAMCTAARELAAVDTTELTPAAVVEHIRTAGAAASQLILSRHQREPVVECETVGDAATIYIGRRWGNITAAAIITMTSEKTNSL